jgi:hypothetical protein
VEDRQAKSSGRIPTPRPRTSRPFESASRLAATKEQLSGVYVVDVPDLDAALSWAARNPAVAYGAVEVRPLGGPPPAA